jgi:methylated-DNA-[protein]-cysteine S-methyltransferase
MPTLFEKRVASPVGILRLLASDEALVGVYFEEHRGTPAVEARPVRSRPILDRAERELAEYFAGTRTRFTVPVEARGTAFQRAVWGALREIPFGERRSYAELARAVGRPRAVRAVGAANGKNPLSIVVPCHRVVGSDGSLTGYAGGLAAKERLLALETRAAR